MTKDAMLILQTVQQFYSDSWTQLVTYTIALLAFVGGLIPVIVQIIQSRTFMAEQTTVRKQLSEEISQAKAELKSALDADYETERIRIEGLIEDKILQAMKKSDRATGAAFHVEGTHHKSGGHFFAAASSFANAASCYLRAEDEANLQRVLRQIVDDCLPKLNKSHFEDPGICERTLNGLVAALEKNNPNGRYKDTIDDIRRGITEAKKRDNA